MSFSGVRSMIGIATFGFATSMAPRVLAQPAASSSAPATSASADPCKQLAQAIKTQGTAAPSVNNNFLLVRCQESRHEQVTSSGGTVVPSTTDSILDGMKGYSAPIAGIVVLLTAMAAGIVGHKKKDDEVENHPRSRTTEIPDNLDI